MWKFHTCNVHNSTCSINPGIVLNGLVLRLLKLNRTIYNSVGEQKFAFQLISHKKHITNITVATKIIQLSIWTLNNIEHIAWVMLHTYTFTHTHARPSTLTHVHVLYDYNWEQVSLTSPWPQHCGFRSADKCSLGKCYPGQMLPLTFAHH